MTREGELRIWHIPLVPGTPFHVSVETPHEAAKLLQVLADYDQFRYEHYIKSDYSNASGLEVYEDGEWCEWYSDDGENIDDSLSCRPCITS